MGRPPVGTGAKRAAMSAPTKPKRKRRHRQPVIGAAVIAAEEPTMARRWAHPNDVAEWSFALALGYKPPATPLDELRRWLVRVIVLSETPAYCEAMIVSAERELRGEPSRGHRDPDDAPGAWWWRFIVPDPYA